MGSGWWRLWAVFVCALTVLCTGGAGAVTPILTQLPATAGCSSETGSGGCDDVHHLDSPESLALSPDGRHLYVVSSISDALLIFDRDLQNGQIDLRPLDAGCLAEVGEVLVCKNGVALDGVTGVAVSPDGSSVYLGSANDNAVVVLERHVVLGNVNQTSPPDGCVSDDGTGGSCANGNALLGVRGVAVSPDGRNVYAAALGSDALVIFDRDASTGALTQKALTEGCVSDTGSAGLCVNGTALDAPLDVVVSPNGRNVYLITVSDSSIAIFDRDPETGALMQKTGLDACLSSDGTNGQCTVASLLAGVAQLAFSPDGRQLYAIAGASEALTIFDIDDSGTLEQLSGTAGCITQTGNGGECGIADVFDGPSRIAVSSDGLSVYVSAVSSDSLVVFDRDPATGALTQAPGLAGCVSETGSGGLCADGRALDSARGVAVSPDARSVYTITASFDAIGVFARGIPVPYDIDGDGQVDPLTDALLLLRYAFGFRGATLVTGAVDLVNCTRCTAADIESFIQSLSG